MISNVNTTDSRRYERRLDIPFFCMYQLGLKIGQRANERRSDNSKQVYVDLYSGHLMLCVIGIMILSALDAFFTLNILATGGEELNIFMAILIEDSITKFISFKLALTALALLLLTIHNNVRIAGTLRVYHLIYMILFGYSSLIGYELMLLNAV